MHFNVKELSSLDVYRYLTNLVAPRPIALVSTIDRDGNINLSPFSFFNIFSSNPPIVIFSPLRRTRDNAMKHTLHNLYEVDEVVIVCLLDIKTVSVLCVAAAANDALK